MFPAGFPDWLHRLSIGSIGGSLACALFIAFDELRRPQRVWIMNIVAEHRPVRQRAMAGWLSSVGPRRFQTRKRPKPSARARGVAAHHRRERGATAAPDAP